MGLNPSREFGEWPVDCCCTGGKMVMLRDQFHSETSQTLTMVFENCRKSLTQHCKWSELRLHFEWTKVNQKCEFWKIPPKSIILSLVSFWTCLVCNCMVDEDCIKLIGKRSTWFFCCVAYVCGSPGTIITGSESMVAAVSIPTPKTVIVFYPPRPYSMLLRLCYLDIPWTMDWTTLFFLYFQFIHSTMYKGGQGRSFNDF